MPDTNLPVTEREAPATCCGYEEEIAKLVDRFYEVARRDPYLGPVFERHVRDWDSHLSTMRDFWSSAVCKTGRYAGRPLDAHRRISDIRAEHFPRWLNLWQGVVDEVVRSDIKQPLKEFAARMASSMSTRVAFTRTPQSGG